MAQGAWAGECRSREDIDDASAISAAASATSRSWCPRARSASTDGNEDGVRAIDVRVSGGLSALVLVDRGLDLGPAWAAGHQVSWQSTTGIVAPAFFDGTTWLRSFHGGLLVTCGLQNIGGPNEDEGVTYGLHGRISNIPARNVVHRVVEEDGRLVAEVAGEVRETDVFGSDLLLRRRLRFPMGEPVVEIQDEVVNQGYVPTAMLILYHVNVGYPVVAEGSVLVPPAGDMVEPRDDAARANVATHTQFPAPKDGFLAAGVRASDRGARAGSRHDRDR